MANFMGVLFAYVVEPSEKSVEIMRKFSEQYARRSETYFCMDKGVTSVVIKVLSFPFLFLMIILLLAAYSNLYCAFTILSCMFMSLVCVSDPIFHLISRLGT